jgi:hypothetical protein
MREKFIQNEIWILVFGGAFQRANIYSDNVSEKERKTYRANLRIYIESNFLEHYKNPIDESEHIKNIIKISTYSIKFKNILKDDKMNFGVCQKLLNLYLKYEWCLKIINEPPHFPVDRIIQEKIKYKPIIAWTKMKDSLDYVKIINHAKIIAVKKSISLADLELQLFNRRTS